MTVPPARIRLARLPTPLQRLERLSAWLGAEVWVKRDDLTGLGTSGNKVRKLEFLLARALADGVDGVVTCGGLHSNHCRATAVACRRLGLDPVLLLRGEIPDLPDGNLLLDRLLGAEIHTCDAETYATARDARMAEIAEAHAARGHRLAVIPEGGSNALGAWGYVAAAAEVADQEAPFDAVVVAVGSGGTLAGLAMGPDIGPILGVAVCDDQATFHRRVRSLMRDHPAGPPRGHWKVTDAYRGPAYGVAQPGVWEDMAEAARREGLLLDPTYSGKAFHAMAEEIRAGRLGGRVLFWHTGGAFGLFGRGAEVPP